MISRQRPRHDPRTVAQLALLIAVVALLGVAAKRDLRDFLIPDAIPLGLAGLFGLNVALGGGDLAGGLIVATVIFLVGAALFARGWLGGGDVKLLSALGLWAGPALIAPTLMIVALAGGLHGLLLLARQHRARRLAAPGAAALDGAAARIPYAVPILAGGVYVAVLSARGVI